MYKTISASTIQNTITVPLTHGFHQTIHFFIRSSSSSSIVFLFCTFSIVPPLPLSLSVLRSCTCHCLSLVTPERAGFSLFLSFSPSDPTAAPSSLLPLAPFGVIRRKCDGLFHYFLSFFRHNTLSVNRKKKERNFNRLINN